MVHRVIRMVVTWRLNRIRCVWWSSFFLAVFCDIFSTSMSTWDYERWFTRKNLFFFAWIIQEEINNDFPLLWILVIKRINKKDCDFQLYFFLYCTEKISLIDNTITVILRGLHTHTYTIFESCLLLHLYVIGSSLDIH